MKYQLENLLYIEDEVIKGPMGPITLAKTVLQFVDLQYLHGLVRVWPEKWETHNYYEGKEKTGFDTLVLACKVMDKNDEKALQLVSVVDMGDVFCPAAIYNTLTKKVILSNAYGNAKYLDRYSEKQWERIFKEIIIKEIWKPIGILPHEKTDS